MPSSDLPEPSHCQGNIWFSGQEAQLVLSKSFFFTTEIIAEQVVGYLQKDGHLFIAKVLFLFLFLLLLLLLLLVW